MNVSYAFGAAHGALAVIAFMSLWWAFGVLYPVLLQGRGGVMSEWSSICECEHPMGGHYSQGAQRMGRCFNIGCPCERFRFARLASPASTS